MAYKITITNSLMQKENHVDAAKFLGWSGAPETDDSWMQVIEQWVKDRMVEELATGACRMNESLYGKLNYDAEQWIEIIRGSTNVVLSEE